jgi:hypothetical protein
MVHHYSNVSFHRDGTYIQQGGRDVGQIVGFDEADARLIAAAPDLLAALERIEDLDWSHDSAESAMVKVQVEAAAAIAKAKGSENVAP